MLRYFNLKVTLLFFGLFCFAEINGVSQNHNRLAASGSIINLEKSDEAIRLVNDSLIGSIIRNDLLLKKIKLICSSHCNETIKVVDNQHVVGQKDSIYSFFDNKDSAIFYLAERKEIPVKIVVNSQRICFAGFIRVGINKAVFKYKLQVPNISDLFFIQDLDGGAIISFEFKGEILSRFTFHGIID